MQKITFLLPLVILLAIAHGEEMLVSQSFTGNDFNDRDGWTTVQEFNANAAIITQCSGTKMFGGFNKFGARSIALKNFILPPHHTLTLKVQVWKIDSWDNEEFYIWVDDQIVWRKHFQVTEGGTQKCGQGGNWFEAIVNVKVDIKHTGPAAVVAFTSSLNEAADNESWAIRDFQLLVQKCPDGCSACSQGEAQDICSAWFEVGNSWVSNDRLKIGSEGWDIAGGKAEGTQCGPLALLGGYDKTGSKTVVGRTFKLPGHYRLKIKLLMAKIDSWDNEEAQLKVDGNIVWRRRYQYHEGYFGRVCGTPHADWRELFSRIEVEAAHTGANTRVEFTTTLNEAPNNESFGLRDFFLFVAKCAKNCDECTGPKPSDCKRCTNNWVVQDGECKPLANFILLEQSFMENQFTGINGWTLKNNKGGATVSQCGGVSMIGGHNVFGRAASAEKTFNLPPHKRIRMQFTVFKIDSWDNEWFFAKVDGVDVWKAQWTVQTGGTNLCGVAGWPDAKFHVDQIFNHHESKATVLFTSSLNEDASNESWGFREFQIFYEPKEACAIFYSECEYKGASFEFCAKSPNFQKDNIPPQIRSIRVPPQGRVTLYENTDYNGKKVVYTQDQPCITQFDFKFAQVHQEEWVQLQAQ